MKNRGALTFPTVQNCLADANRKKSALSKRGEQNENFAPNHALLIRSFFVDHQKSLAHCPALSTLLLNLVHKTTNDVSLFFVVVGVVVVIYPFTFINYCYYFGNITTTMMEWLLYGLLALITGLAMLIISPRFKGGKDAPPVVTNSPVVPIPLIGVIAEFFKSPNTMIKRCYKDYGPVYTIPVCHGTRRRFCLVICNTFLTLSPPTFTKKKTCTSLRSFIND